VRDQDHVVGAPPPRFQELLDADCEPGALDVFELSPLPRQGGLARHDRLGLGVTLDEPRRDAGDFELDGLGLADVEREVIHVRVVALALVVESLLQGRVQMLGADQRGDHQATHFAFQRDAPEQCPPSLEQVRGLQAVHDRVLDDGAAHRAALYPAPLQYDVADHRALRGILGDRDG